MMNIQPQLIKLHLYNHIIGNKTYEVSPKDTISDLRNNVSETTELFMYENFQFQLEDHLKKNLNTVLNPKPTVTVVKKQITQAARLFQWDSEIPEVELQTTTTIHEAKTTVSLSTSKALSQFVQIGEVLTSGSKILIVFNSYDQRSCRFHYQKVRNVLENPFLLISQNVKNFQDYVKSNCPTFDILDSGKQANGENIQQQAISKSLDFFIHSINQNKILPDLYQQSSASSYAEGKSMMFDGLNEQEQNSQKQKQKDISKSSESQKHQQQKQQSQKKIIHLQNLLSCSGFNPPVYYRKMMGDYFYLLFKSPQQIDYHITGNSQGFFVNQSTNCHFNPNISTKFTKIYTSLLDLLLIVSPKLKQLLKFKLVSGAKGKQSYEYQKWMVSGGGFMAVMGKNSQWMTDAFSHSNDITKINSNNREQSTTNNKLIVNTNGKSTTNNGNNFDNLWRIHSCDKPTTQPHNSIYGNTNFSNSAFNRRQQTPTIKDWNEMFQIQHLQPCDSYFQKINKEKLRFKIYQQFIEHVKVGVYNILEKNILPLNPNCPKGEEKYLFANIYFSFVDNSFDESDFRRFITKEKIKKQEENQHQHQRQHQNQIQDQNSYVFRFKNTKQANNYINNLQLIDNMNNNLLNDVHLSHSILVSYRGYRLRAQTFPSSVIYNKQKTHKEKQKQSTSSSNLKLNQNYHYQSTVDDIIHKKNIFKSPMPILKQKQYQDILLKVCFNLNLQYENIVRMKGTQQLKKINLDSRLTGIQTIDKRKYIFHLERLSPKDYNFLDDGNEYSVFRHELIELFQQKQLSNSNKQMRSNSNVSLNTMLGWNFRDFNLFYTQKIKTQQNKLKQMALFAKEYVINIVISLLESTDCKKHLADTRSVIDFMHKYGLNCRYLGLVYKKINKTKSPQLSIIFEKVIYVKCVKNLLNTALKSTQSRNVRKMIAHIFNCLFDGQCYHLYGENEFNNSKESDSRTNSKEQNQNHKTSKSKLKGSPYKKDFIEDSIITNNNNNNHNGSQFQSNRRKKKKNNSGRDSTNYSNNGNYTNANNSGCNKQNKHQQPLLCISAEEGKSDYFLSITPQQLSQIIKNIAKIKYNHVFENYRKNNQKSQSKNLIYPRIFSLNYGKYSTLRDICLSTYIVLQKRDYFLKESSNSNIINRLNSVNKDISKSDNNKQSHRRMFYFEDIITLGQKIKHISPDKKQINKLISEGDNCLAQFLIEESIESYNKAIQYILTTFGGNCEQLPIIHKKLSFIYFKIGDIDTAILFSNHALIMLEEFYSANNPTNLNSHSAATSSNVAPSNNNNSYENVEIIQCLMMLGVYHIAKRSFTSAQTYLSKAIYYSNVAYSQAYPQVLTLWMNLATVYEVQKKFTEAIMCLHEGLKTSIKIYGQNHLNTAVFYTAMASLHFEIPDIAQAIRFKERAIMVFKKVLPEKDQRIKESVEMLEFYKSLQNSKKIKEYHEKQQRKINHFLANMGVSGMMLGGNGGLQSRGHAGNNPHIGKSMNGKTLPPQYLLREEQLWRRSAGSGRRFKGGGLITGGKACRGLYI